MRWGEATALRVGDVDLARGEVRVREAWKDGEGARELGPPKSKKSRRTVPVTSAAAAAVAR